MSAYPRSHPNRIILQRPLAAGDRFLMCKMLVPTHLHAVDGTTAETTFKTWDALQLPHGDLLSKVPRVVELSCRDDAGSNDRAERFLRLQAPDRPRVTFSCDDHKACTIESWCMDLSLGLETNLIRVALAMRGGEAHTIRAQARQILGERLEAHYGGHPSVEAGRHRAKFYSLFVSGKDPPLKA